MNLGTDSDVVVVDCRYSDYSDFVPTRSCLFVVLLCGSDCLCHRPGQGLDRLLITFQGSTAVLL